MSKLLRPSSQRLARAPSATAILGLVSLLALTALAGCGKSEQKSAAPASSAPAVSLPAFAPVAGQNLPGLEALPTQGTCSVENLIVLPGDRSQPAVQNTYAAPVGADVKFIGFATQKDKGEPLARFSILLTAGQTFSASAEAGLERPDVVSFFGKPGLLKSGFQADVSLKGIPAGEYVIMFRAGEGPICPTHQKLKIG